VTRRIGKKPKTSMRRSGDIEIEDLFDFDFYLKAVNLTYEKLFKERLDRNSLEEQDFEEKSFRGIKNYFRKSGQFKRLDKVKVSYKIADLIGAGDKPDEHTISNFSKLFKKINEKLA
jgi:hypothetical protein